MAIVMVVNVNSLIGRSKWAKRHENIVPMIAKINFLFAMPKNIPEKIIISGV